MSEAKHTPGPWHFKRSMWTPTVPADGFGIYVEGRRRQICGNNQNDPGNGEEPFMPWGEMEANAQLITAAPNLLAALKNLVGMVERREGNVAWPDVLLALEAIALAEGRP